MEFFERAHVVKPNHNTDDNMKKQLKQMLYGYKQNDNRLIRDAANIERDEDSTSVSGFSDLNLTVSSSEGNTTRQRISFIGSESVKDNISLDDSDESKSNKSANLGSSFDENASLPKTSDVSLSDINENIESLSEASISIDENDESDNFSMTSTTVSSATDLESSASEPFDYDGRLASKILEKLKLKDNPKPSKKERKRKLEQRPEPEIDSQDSYAVESDYSNAELNSDIESESNSQSSINYTNVVSPSFVSITALDMPSESLGDILGDYTYPTVRNLPSESQNVFATNKSGIFSTAQLDITNVSVNTKDACAFDSLLPELGSELDITPDVDLEPSTDMPVDETSLSYDTTAQSETTFQREASTESVNTNFVNPVNIFFGKKCCILVLKHPAEIYIHGKVRVTSLGGSVEIGGYNLKNKTYNVYAPNYNCAQYLRTLEHEIGFYGLFGKLTGSGLSVAVTEEIVTTLGDHDSVVLMQPLHDRVAQFVENNCMATDLFSKTNKNVDGCFKKASDFLGCSLYLMKPWKSFEENACWSRALQHGYKNQSRGVVCGGKGSGKSSFLRYYVNKLLARGPVLVVDLDPGQSEFTPAGGVSAAVVSEPLLGPAFTHLKTPERMLNIGLISTMDNPRRYAAAIAEILAYCAEPRLRDMPWIVNTMGMCNGLGLQFMTLIILLLQPTFVLQIDSKNPKKRFAHYLNPDTVKMLYNKYQHNYLFKSLKVRNELDYELVISSSDSVKSNFSLPPRDERYLNFLAYFGSMLNNYNTDDFLLGVVPYEVDLRNLYVAVNVRIDRDSIARVINGKIVALCKHSGDSADKIFTLADKPLHCYGHGLIRGLDAQRGMCYVVTPAPAEALAHVDTLVYADWAPELALRGALLPRGTAVPYRAPHAAQQRRLMSSPRRRYNPVQLLKMSRSPKVKASIS